MTTLSCRVSRRVSCRDARATSHRPVPVPKYLLVTNAQKVAKSVVRSWSLGKLIYRPPVSDARESRRAIEP